MRICDVAVIGAGTMGSQIAALCSSLGLRVRLLDVALPGADDRSQLARRALQRLRGLKPAPAFLPSALERIRVGNLEDDLSLLAEADWVVEAVVERLPVKREVWGRLAAHVRPDAVLSTNTSGLGIAAIAAALPAPLRRRFLGTHFYNPPRYLHLLELIPGPETDPQLVEAMAAFGRDVLGKGVVVCRDTPYFIGNRLGIYGMMMVFRAMEEFGLGPDAVDRITGPALGRPRSATFRTLDIVGLDVFADVVRNLAEALPEEADVFRLPGWVEALVQQGRLGEKSGAGFYRRQGDEILVVDPETLEYRRRRSEPFASLELAGRREDLGERLRLILNADDVAGRFAWSVTSSLWLYAAQHLETIAGGRVDAVDQAMRWGFGWEMGPFESWDAFGVQASLDRLTAEGAQLPPALAAFRASGRSRWYEEREEGIWFWTPRDELIPVARDPKALSFADRKRAGGLVRRWPGASLVDLGDGVLGVELHSPKDAIGPDVINALQAAVDLSRDWRAVVIGTDRPNFGVGANLALLLPLAQEGDWDALDAMVRTFQRTLMDLKFLEVPVVAAIGGLALGGAAEIGLAAARVVAAAETYMGLVEVGAGLVPAGGGCKELLLRALAGPNGPAAAGDAGSPALLPPPDPQPAVARVFQTIATARVSGSAAEARMLGFLRPCDRIVSNRDQLLWAARQEALRLADDGWLPPDPVTLPAPGPDVRAALEWAAYYMCEGGWASEHDLKVARELAWVLTGGDVPAGTPCTEQDLLELERQAFIRLCHEPKTQERMVHLLQRGKPLRN